MLHSCSITQLFSIFFHYLRVQTNITAYVISSVRYYLSRVEKADATKIVNKNSVKQEKCQNGHVASKQQRKK